MSFKIIKNVPPLERAKGGRGGKPPIYKFADMEVGDAFDAPRDRGKYNTGTDRRQASIINSGRQYAKRYNPTAKFSTTLLDDNTVRCRRDA